MLWAIVEEVATEILGEAIIAEDILVLIIPMEVIIIPIQDIQVKIIPMVVIITLIQDIQVKIILMVVITTATRDTIAKIILMVGHITVEVENRIIAE